MFPILDISIPVFIRFVQISRVISIGIFTFALYHLILSAIFARKHLDFIAVFDVVPGTFIPYVFFILDNALIGLTVFSFVMKGKLLKFKYLSTSANSAFFWVIIASLSMSFLFEIVSNYSLVHIYLAEPRFEASFLKIMTNYPNGQLKPYLDRVQIKYKCCGLRGSKDWFTIGQQGVKENQSDNFNLPPYSCCVNQTNLPCVKTEERKYLAQLIMKGSNQTHFWSNGCLDKFEISYKSRYVNLSLCGILLSLLNALYSISDRLIQSGISVPPVNYKYRCWIIGKAVNSIRSKRFSTKTLFTRYKFASEDDLFREDPLEKNFEALQNEMKKKLKSKPVDKKQDEDTVKD